MVVNLKEGLKPYLLVQWQYFGAVGELFLNVCTGTCCPFLRITVQLF